MVATKRKKTRKKTQRDTLLKRASWLYGWPLMIAVVALVVSVGYFVVRGGHASSCTVDANLVNSCRPWLGGWANHYTQVAADAKSQILYQEQRIGRQNDLVHTYHPVGSNALDASDLFFVNRPNTYLYANWKPAASWADASGSNATTNAGIDQMAASIKAVAPHKVMLALNGEPERFVSGGSSGCPSTIYQGSAGTPADFRAMYRNVYNRFNSDGATNVVWVLNLTGYVNWDCMINDLWPGNDIINWVMWDPYGADSSTFNSSVSAFYNWLGTNSNSTHDYLSKPWGLAEYGSHQTSQADVYKYYADAKAAVDKNTFPKLKAYTIFDSNATWDTRTLYTATGAVDQTEQNDYNAFAKDAAFTDAGLASTPTPTPKPTPTPTPTKTPTPTATPKPTATPTATPSGTPIPDGGPSPSPTPTPIPLPPPGVDPGPPPTVSGNIDITPTDLPADTTSTEFLVDGKAVPSGVINTDALSNGDHTVETETITANGQTLVRKRTIIVKNHKTPWQTLVEGLHGRWAPALVAGFVLLIALVWFGIFRLNLVGWVRERMTRRTL